jgi:hypothetical protein
MALSRTDTIVDSKTVTRWEINGKILLLSRREIRGRHADRSYTMGYIPIGSSHIALFVIGYIRICAISARASRTPIRQIILCIDEFIRLIVRITCTW